MTRTGDVSMSVMLESESTLAIDVVEGLSANPKRLPSKYLYDSLGSQLFQAICELPWYNITNGEIRLLKQCSEAIMSKANSPSILVELGSGNGSKMLSLLSNWQFGQQSPVVHFVDISPAALELSTLNLSQYNDSLTVVPHESTYEKGLEAALAERDERDTALVLFLGSNIGNLNQQDAEHFLKNIRTRSRPGDRFLLGTDLVKPECDLLMAYDDPLGVTAAFNKNLLARLNRELDADFDLSQFNHRVVWNAAASRVESYLESQIDQVVCLTGADCCVSLSAGERIWTESSYKYEPETVIAMCEGVGFTQQAQWIDSDSQFALTLLETK